MMAAPTSGIAKASVNVCVSHRATVKFAATMVVVVPAGHVLLGRSAPPAGNVWRLVHPSVRTKNVALTAAAASVVAAPAMVIAPPMAPVPVTPNAMRLGNVGIMVVAETAARAL